MPDVRELFPDLEKAKRVKRGHQPKMVFSTPPSFVQVIPKLAPTVMDSLVRTVNSHGNIVEMQRYILRNNNRFGYLCFKTANIALSGCRSYADLQRVFDALAADVKWQTSWQRLTEYVASHCTSPSYVTRVRQLQA